MDLSGIFIVTVPTLRADFISDFGKLVIIFCVFTKASTIMNSLLISFQQ